MERSERKWPALAAVSLLFSFLLALIALGGIACAGDMPAAAAAPPPVEITLSPNDVVIQSGQTFSLTVWVVAGAQPLDAVQIVLQYDGSALDNTAITDGSTLPVVLVRQTGGTSGMLRYEAGILGSEGATGTFALCILRFQGVGLAKDSPIDFERAAVFKGGVPLSVSTAGGTATVNGAFAIFMPALSR